MSKIIKRIFISFLCLIVLSSICTTIGYASSNFQLPNIFDKYTVYKGGSTYLPNFDQYPFNKYDVKSIGFDTLYGSSKEFFEYFGEIPFKAVQDDADNLGKYRIYNGTTIGGSTRLYSTSEISSDDKIDNDLNSDSREPHIWAMTRSHSSFDFGWLLMMILNGLNWLAQLVVNLMITFKSLNLLDIVNLIDGNGTFSGILSKLFIYDTSTNEFSPLLLFALISFIIGLIGISFKYFRKGSGSSFRGIINELGMLLGAVAIASIFLSGGNALKLSKVSMDFITALTNDISTSGGAAVVYYYDTGDANIDNAQTQRGLINKIYIDQLINAQFGYSVNQLNIDKLDEYDVIEAAMQKTFNNGGHDTMKVCTTTDITINDRSINNLGYYLWAANSSVACYSTGGAFYGDSDSKTTQISPGTSDRMLYVIDFLSNLRAETENSAVVSKIDNIMNCLTVPQYGSACANIFGVLVLNICLCFSLFIITLFCIIGQLIVTLGSYAMVIMPTLLLFNKTRDFAKKLIWTYLLGFVRFLIGSILFNTVILIATTLAESGFLGLLTASIVVLILGRFTPRLISEINTALESLGRGKEMPFMTKFYNNSNSFINKFSHKSKRNARRNATQLAADGSITERGGIKSVIKEGINRRQKNNNPNFNIANGDEILNPVADNENDYKFNTTYNINNGDTKNNNSGDNNEDKFTTINDAFINESNNLGDKVRKENDNNRDDRVIVDNEVNDKKNNKASNNDKERIKRNRKMRLESQIPFIGNILNNRNKSILQNEEKIKNDLIKKIIFHGSNSKTPISLNQAFNLAKKSLISQYKGTDLAKYSEIIDSQYKTLTNADVSKITSDIEENKAHQKKEINITNNIAILNANGGYSGTNTDNGDNSNALLKENNYLLENKDGNDENDQYEESDDNIIIIDDNNEVDIEDENSDDSGEYEEDYYDNVVAEDNTDYNQGENIEQISNNWGFHEENPNKKYTTKDIDEMCKHLNIKNNDLLITCYNMSSDEDFLKFTKIVENSDWENKDEFIKAEAIKYFDNPDSYKPTSKKEYESEQRFEEDKEHYDEIMDEIDLSNMLSENHEKGFLGFNSDNKNKKHNYNEIKELAKSNNVKDIKGFIEYYDHHSDEEFDKLLDSIKYNSEGNNSDTGDKIKLQNNKTIKIKSKTEQIEPIDGLEDHKTNI